jgi:alanyl-tRNA synthetase
MKSSEIRQAFFDYFVKHNHQLVDSSPLVPGNDPTLLFTNAGMVQFKETFLGVEKRPYSRAVSSQRCVRAGGKHNDLENVGYTARHHTFFEMLGNFSFGDYFKREAIGYAWDFLTKTLNIPAEKLWITVYTDDDEAADIWLNEIGVSKQRFSRCGEKDNSWSMGDTGPCGPCTEIFYDHGEAIPGGPPGTPEEDGDRYIEIWNIVFMQYNRDKEGKLHPLPKPSVDTGMGLERIAAVVQGVHTNYDIDSFQHIIKAIAKLANIKDLEHPSLKVVADHIRACSFLIVDGVMPGNEGRGYVLRRIIRRAIRHGHKLGLESPFFYQLLTPLIDVMGEAYPELVKNKNQVEKILKQEENQFARTLDQGLNLLQGEIKALDDAVIPGEVAFKLYDTYGFPYDLTADIAREQQLTVDEAAFNQCMQKQRLMSQSASQFQADYSESLDLNLASEFKGYEQDSEQSDISGLLVEGKSVEQMSKGTIGAVVLNLTPFYAESGGQVGDRGLITSQGVRFQVEDTQKKGDAILHYGTLLEGALKLNQTVDATIDATRRNAIRLNHTATHLLHAALKEVVGEHVHQKGSLVDAEKARFDFSNFEPLTDKQVDVIETLVNDKIRENLEVSTDIMNIEDAKKKGAVALFGEKYDEHVRVLTMGSFSKELCGGTHAKRTGDIGIFKITAEYGIASGVRRIEMVTGQYALRWVNEQLQLLNNVANQLKSKPSHAPEKLSQSLQEAKSLEKELSQLKSKLAAQSGKSLVNDAKQIGAAKVLIKGLDNVDGKTLRATLDQLKTSLEKGVIVLYSVDGPKISVIAGVSKDILGQVPSAPEYVKALCGKGGGREDMAQGGGQAPDDLSERIKAIEVMIAEHNQ